MSEEQMIYCLIAFVLGYLLSRQMGNGFSVGMSTKQCPVGPYVSVCREQIPMSKEIKAACKVLSLITCNDTLTMIADLKDKGWIKKTGAPEGNCTSGLNFNGMFYNNETFNQDISSWNVSNVTEMQQLFYGTSVFNQPLNNWDVSSVTNMAYMFYNANVFNQPLNNWDVKNVDDMSYMFEKSVFNQNIDSWDVSKVTAMFNMFYNATTFDQDLSKWDVSKVTNMSNMFSGLSYKSNQKIWMTLNNWLLKAKSINAQYTRNIKTFCEYVAYDMTDAPTP